jgi:alpha-mannosidase
VAALEIASEIGPVALNLLVILFRDDPVVRCTLRLDNRGQDQRLRARFSPGGDGMPACAGAQLGSQVRAAVTHRPHVLETPVATAPAHRFLGVGGSAPFALFAPGFFEYELEPGGDILFTILRSVGELSRGDLATRPGHAGWPTATPLAQCPGPDAIDLAFALGGSDWGDPARLQESWENLFVRLTPFWVRDWNGTAAVPGGVELDGDGLAFSAFVPARSREGVVLRCFNLRDRVVEGRARFGFPVSQVERVRADETVLEKLDPAGDEVRFRAGPREVVSLLVRGGRT